MGAGDWPTNLVRNTGYNYGKNKNQTNFDRAKTYEDVDRFA